MTQGNATNETTTILQTGSAYNTAYVDQYREGNDHTYVVQAGDRNMAAVHQTDGGSNLAFAVQVGSNNNVDLTKRGAFESTLLAGQGGGFYEAKGKQSGSYEEMALAQVGYFNSADASQAGSYNTASIIQVGNANYGSVLRAVSVMRLRSPKVVRSQGCRCSEVRNAEHRLGVLRRRRSQGHSNPAKIFRSDHRLIAAPVLSINAWKSFTSISASRTVERFTLRLYRSGENGDTRVECFPAVERGVTLIV